MGMGVIKARREKPVLSVVLTAAALAALKKFKVDQIIVIFGCGIVYALAEFVQRLV